LTFHQPAASTVGATERRIPTAGHNLRGKAIMSRHERIAAHLADDPSPRRWIRAATVVGVAAGAVSVVRVAGAVRARRELRWRPGRGARHDGILSARVLGAAGVPMVLLHGQAGSGRYWGAVYDRLAVGHRMVVPDLLGFGSSPRPDVSYDAERHADAVLGCLDELGIAEPAVLVGHSMGCIVALRLATRLG
jgi:hypothetical protein